MTTFWITKYALSKGIFEIDSEARTEAYHKAGQFSVKDTRPGAYGYNSFNEKEAFTLIDDARQDADSRRMKKIASLRKQIVNLERLSF